MKTNTRPIRKRPLLFAAALALAAAAHSAHAERDVPFSFLAPNADRVHLLGDFNAWKPSDDSLMARDPSGFWRKTIPLPDGTNAYAFFAEGPSVPASGWMQDWKSSRVLNDSDEIGPKSLLVLPGDLESFLARQAPPRISEDGSIAIPLFYDRAPEDYSYFSPYGHQFAALSSSPPAGDWSIPPLDGALPLFALLSFGDSRLLAVLDRSPADAPFYNRLRLDRNFDRNLSNDDPIPLEPDSNGDYVHCFPPPVDLEVPAGNRSLPYSFRIQFGGPASSNALSDPSTNSFESFHFLAFPNCAYLGEVSIDGSPFRIALGDANANGRFGDPAAPLSDDVPSPGKRAPFGGDSLFLSPGDRPNYVDNLPFGHFLSLGSRLFAVRLDLPNGTMTLSPLSAGLAHLEFPASVDSMALFSPSDSQVAMLKSVGLRAPIPPGSWRLVEYAASKSDEWGDRWSISASASVDSPTFDAPPGDPVPFPFGEPLVAAVEINSNKLARAAGGRLEIDLAIYGRQKEIVDSVARVSGTNSLHATSKRRSDRPAEPQCRIVKPDGERVFSGSFEYG